MYRKLILFIRQKLIKKFLFWRLIKGRESDGFPEFQEKFLRQVLREFPYAESELLQQMVRNLANTQIVSISLCATGAYQ